MRLGLLISLAFVAFAAATTDRKTVFVDDNNGVIVVTNKDRRAVHIFMDSRDDTQERNNRIEVQVTTPNMVTKTVQFVDDKAKKDGVNQRERLIKIFRQHHGNVDEDQFRKLIETVEQHVRSNEIDRSVFFALQVLDSQNRQVTPENPFGQMTHHGEYNKLVAKRSGNELLDIYQGQQDSRFNVHYPGVFMRTDREDHTFGDNTRRFQDTLRQRDFDRSMDDTDRDFSRDYLRRMYDEDYPRHRFGYTRNVEDDDTFRRFNLNRMDDTRFGRFDRDDQKSRLNEIMFGRRYDDRDMSTRRYGNDFNRFDDRTRYQHTGDEMMPRQSTMTVRALLVHRPDERRMGRFDEDRSMEYTGDYQTKYPSTYHRRMYDTRSRFDQRDDRDARDRTVTY